MFVMSKKLSGLALLACGFALPAIGYTGGRIYADTMASYGGPPNQGVMVLAFLVLASSFLAGFWMILTGAILTMVQLRNPPHSY